MASSTTDRRLGLTGGTAFKAPVVAATTANITLSGTQTIDGVACVADDRVLVMNQTTASENGIYDVSSASWTRSLDFDGNLDIVKGTTVYVLGGTQAGYWRVATDNPITIHTTSLSFERALANDISTYSYQSTQTDSASRSLNAKLGDIISVSDFNASTSATAASSGITPILSTSGNLQLASLTVIGQSNLSGGLSSTKAVASGYTRITPNLCYATTGIGSVTLTSTQTTVAAPSTTATLAIINASLSINSVGSTGSRSGYILGMSSDYSITYSILAQPAAVEPSSAAGVVSGLTLARDGSQSIVPISNGNIYLEILMSNSTSYTASYRFDGYFEP